MVGSSAVLRLDMNKVVAIRVPAQVHPDMVEILSILGIRVEEDEVADADRGQNRDLSGSVSDDKDASPRVVHFRRSARQRAVISPRLAT